MITRTLSRRLVKLEESMIPSIERKAWQIVIFDSDRSRRDGPVIEWQRLGRSNRFQRAVPVSSARYR
jgi:hypothetical protein